MIIIYIKIKDTAVYGVSDVVGNHLVLDFHAMTSPISGNVFFNS